MFVSFFPRPRLFFGSAVVWTALIMGVWYAGGRAFGAHLGMPPANPSAPPPIGIGYFWSPAFVWFDIYYWVAVGLFAGIWQAVAPHPWWRWSVLGSALIVFVTYLQVEVSVIQNNYFGVLYNLIQAALTHNPVVPALRFYSLLLTFFYLGLAYVTVYALIAFFISHYIFRWRTAMNNFYMSHWEALRVIEGASQRIQEDTMRFSQTTEDLGSSLITSVLTLVAFLPVLVRLSANVTMLPLVGRLPYSLVIAAVLWSAFGTMFLALIGIKLPGLNFRNQRVEAAYRKELVYGEDDPSRAQPPAVRELFARVRKNYFKLYFNYLYFNVGRYLYLQADGAFGLVIMIPTIVAGAITFGTLQQIFNVFDQVRGSFQYLVNSWSTIVELQSIYKRLRTFEASLDGAPLPAIEDQPEPA